MSEQQPCNCGEGPIYPMMGATTETHERWLTFQPGYKCPRPFTTDGSSHGMHGMDLVFYTRNRKTQVVAQLRLMTPWDPTACKPRAPIINEVLKSADIHYPAEKEDGFPCTLMPSGYCRWDGSGLFGEELFRILRDRGVEAMYEQLEKWADG